MTRLRNHILQSLARHPLSADDLLQQLPPSTNPSRLTEELISMANVGMVRQGAHGTWGLIIDPVTFPPMEAAGNDNWPDRLGVAQPADRGRIRHQPRKNEQNDHVLTTLATAAAAANDLAAQGFTVLGVEIGNRNPVISIQGERRCQQLRGALKVIHGAPGRREETWACRHMGAQVEWRAQP